MIQIDKSWLPVLKESFEVQSFKALKGFLKQEIQTGKTIYPHPKNIFAAFDACPWDTVKVVLLGQDPYHTPGAAHGMAFSVPQGVRVPPSLQNMYKEMNADLQARIPTHGCLTGWAQQGVLLLNSVLTVEKSKPASHARQGWEEFTDNVIQKLSEQKENLVFVLWGKYAQTRGQHIDRTKHCVIEAPHPSPFSAQSGFFGHRPYSRTNEYLQAHNKTPINWTDL